MFNFERLVHYYGSIRIHIAKTLISTNFDQYHNITWHTSVLFNNLIISNSHFRFNLLDNIITNSSFVNAVKPDFPIERVSVKLRGTLEHVYKYLASVKDVSLQLCQGTKLYSLFVD